MHFGIITLALYNVKLNESIYRVLSVDIMQRLINVDFHLPPVDMCIQQSFLTSRIRVSNWYSKCHDFLFWKEDYVPDKIGTLDILCPTCMACSSQCGHQWAYSVPIHWLTASTIAMIVRQEFMMHQIRHGSWFMLMEFTVLTPPSRNNCPKRTIEWHFKGS